MVESSRSDRLTQTLTACSTTPRSGRKYLEELARMISPDPNEYLYTEAKLALVEQDVDAARALLDSCPAGYKRVSKYRKQCTLYTNMCDKGLVHRGRTHDLRACLAELCEEDAASLSVGRYTDALARQGYTAAVVRDVNMATMHAVMDAAQMQRGHRQLIEARAEAQTPAVEWVFWKVIASAERCLGVARCLQTATAPVIPTPMVGKEDDPTAE